MHRFTIKNNNFERVLRATINTEIEIMPALYPKMLIDSIKKEEKSAQS